ncbi:MAG: metal-dependent hydrolase, partial [Cyanobacteria bacterium J06639_1]
MMSRSHIAFSVAFSSLLLGTAQPVPLAIAGAAALLPDMDTSKSLSGRLLFPVSSFFEKRFPHRSLTHSFAFTLFMAAIASPLWVFAGVLYWKAFVLGYFLGWFADCFTKSGVVAFWPYDARLVVPGNPRMRLS